MNYNSQFLDVSISTTKSHLNEISSIYDNVIFFITKESKKENYKIHPTSISVENKKIIDSFFDNFELEKQETLKYSTCTNFIEQYL
jgi:hypothetical protein